MARRLPKVRLKVAFKSLRRAQEELREERRQLNQRLVTILSTTIGVVAGLFWQTAITDTIKTFIPVSGAWYYEIGVALFVTAILVVVLIWLTRINPAPAPKA